MSLSAETIAFVVQMHELGAMEVAVGDVYVKFRGEEEQPEETVPAPEPELTPEQRKAQAEELLYGSSI